MRVLESRGAAEVRELGEPTAPVSASFVSYGGGFGFRRLGGDRRPAEVPRRRLRVRGSRALHGASSRECERFCPLAGFGGRNYFLFFFP